MNYFTDIASGSAAARLTCAPAWHDKTVVVIPPDSGERYLSTTLFILTG